MINILESIIRDEKGDRVSGTSLNGGMAVIHLAPYNFVMEGKYYEKNQSTKREDLL